MAVLLSRWACSHSPRCQRQRTRREDRRPSSSTSYGTTSSGVGPQAKEDSRYRVEIPFRTATMARLACPFELPDGARVEARLVDEQLVDENETLEKPVEVLSKTTTFAADGSVLEQVGTEGMVDP